MSGYLLSLAALHAAAPGVLDVVFGADGDFDGAPDWRPPLACEDDWATDYRITDGACWVYKGSHGNTVQWLVDFDLRVPSVAARLAGLCARALGVGVGDGWSLVCEVHPGVLYRLVGVLTTGRSVMAGAWLSTGRSFHTEAKIRADVQCPPHGPDPAAFLAALTLALAPQIAALGASR